MTETTTDRDPDDLQRRGEDILRHVVQPNATPEDHGKYVAIDVDTGEYVIDRDDAQAIVRVQASQPGAAIWLARIGYRTTYRFGGMR